MEDRCNWSGIVGVAMPANTKHKYCVERSLVLDDSNLVRRYPGGWTWDDSARERGTVEKGTGLAVSTKN